jgi:transcriptional regulator with GAF, ATPase, and Fis domain
MTFSHDLPEPDDRMGLAASFAALAKELARHSTRADAVAAIVEHARTAIPGAEDAGLTIQRGDGTFDTVATTGDLPMRVDSVQYATGEGPCLDSLRQHHVFVANDLRSDPRWPEFARAANERTGVLSMMSHRLFLEDDETIGALNLYATKADAFTDASVPMLSMYATHAAIAFTLADGQERADQLQVALQSNRNIGVAIGILMATYKVTNQQAFDLLRMVSQRTHRKLASIALDVVDTGILVMPEAPGRG